MAVEYDRRRRIEAIRARTMRGVQKDVNTCRAATFQALDGRCKVTKPDPCKSESVDMRDT